MGGFLKKNRRKVEPVATDPEPEYSDDVSFEDDFENDLNDESGMSDPPKRRKGNSVAIELDDEDNRRVDTSSSSDPEPSKAASVQRVRLSADIAKPLHRRLKLHSITTDRSILAILESWIQQHTPE